MDILTIYYNIRDCGDGSATLDFYLTEEICEAAIEHDNSNDAYSLGYGSINTYENSPEHIEAIQYSSHFI